ncbi:MAG: hypothetical protein WBA74_18990, partial [Cyclobacteriaceae bacterium]
MIKIYGNILTCLLTLFTFWLASAQDQDPKWNADGEIEEAEFVFVKDKKLELPKANRFYVPVRIDKNEITGKTVTFRVKEFDFTPQISLPEIRVQKIPKEPIEKLWGNKLTLGYGNFQSPYVDLSLANKRDKLYSYGFNFNHHSFGTGAVDDGNSASGITDVEAFGKIFGKKATSYANIGYQHQFDHFYGYRATDSPPDADSIRQRFNRFDIKTGIFGTDIENPLRYKVELGFNNFSNDFDTKERTFDLNSDFRYKLKDDESLMLELDGRLSQYTDSTEINRNLLTITPAYARKISGIYLTIGFQVAIDNDTLDTSSGASLFPQFNVRFPVSETFDVYGGITGGRQFNTINSFSRENPWIGRNQPLLNSNTKIEVYGGVNGKLGQRV